MPTTRLHRKSDDEPGYAHELTFSCYHRYRFLQAERTCLWLTEAIERARSRLKFELWAYVFMPEHVHLLIGPTGLECGVASILKAIKGPVGRWAIDHLSEHVGVALAGNEC
ncbi:MAG TPA: transposase [Isosphaeraceae bacterium]|nr:transposase [Isosphaeraceae bacterium]